MIENKATFFARLEPRMAPSDLYRVQGAYYLAKHAHRAQKRKEIDEEGEPLRYFEHVRRVAIVLMDEAHIYDPDLICIALLHDVLEDTDISVGVLEQLFGTKVAQGVVTLTKIPKEGYFERIQWADPTLRLIKLCDRLDNMRALPAEDHAFIQKTLKDTELLLNHYHPDPLYTGLWGKAVSLAGEIRDKLPKNP